MMMFLKKSTETLPSKNPKNPKNYPETWYVNEKILTKHDIIYIVENVFRSSIQ